MLFAKIYVIKNSRYSQITVSGRNRCICSTSRAKFATFLNDSCTTKYTLHGHTYNVSRFSAKYDARKINFKKPDRDGLRTIVVRDFLTSARKFGKPLAATGVLKAMLRSRPIYKRGRNWYRNFRVFSPRETCLKSEKSYSTNAHVHVRKPNRTIVAIISYYSCVCRFARRRHDLTTFDIAI